MPTPPPVPAPNHMPTPPPTPTRPDLHLRPLRADDADAAGGLGRLELGHRANNPASGGVARRAGFTPEGTQRGYFLIDGIRHDVHLWGRLADDPPSGVAPLPFRG
jgi:hypothetical protein